MNQLNTLSELGKKVRKLRAAKNLTQEELAARSKLDRSYISGIERGLRNPTVATLCDIAQVLDVPVAALFVFTKNNQQPNV